MFSILTSSNLYLKVATDVRFIPITQSAHCLPIPASCKDFISLLGFKVSIPFFTSSGVHSFKRSLYTGFSSLKYINNSSAITCPSLSKSVADIIPSTFSLSISDLIMLSCFSAPLSVIFLLSESLFILYLNSLGINGNLENSHPFILSS